MVGLLDWLAEKFFYPVEKDIERANARPQGVTIEASTNVDQLHSDYKVAIDQFVDTFKQSGTANPTNSRQSTNPLLKVSLFEKQNDTTGAKMVYTTYLKKISGSWATKKDETDGMFEINCDSSVRIYFSSPGKYVTSVYVTISGDAAQKKFPDLYHAALALCQAK